MNEEQITGKLCLRSSETSGRACWVVLTKARRSSCLVRWLQQMAKQSKQKLSENWVMEYYLPANSKLVYFITVQFVERLRHQSNIQQRFSAQYDDNNESGGTIESKTLWSKKVYDLVFMLRYGFWFRHTVTLFWCMTYRLQREFYYPEYVRPPEFYNSGNQNGNEKVGRSAPHRFLSIKVYYTMQLIIRLLTLRSSTGEPIN